MSFNLVLLNSGINIVIYINKIINIDNDPNLNAFFVYVIKYCDSCVIESVSSALYETAARPSDAVTISTKSVGKPILHPSSEHSKPTKGTIPESIDKATNTYSYVIPEATTSNATTSETNSRKRSQPTPEGNVSKQPKQMVNETDSMLHDTFTTTGHFSILPEPVTNPEVPVNPYMDELSSDVLLDKDVSMFDNNRATSSPSVFSEISSDVMDYSSLNLDDNSNYSFALTEEEKLDSFIQYLMYSKDILSVKEYIDTCFLTTAVKRWTMPTPKQKKLSPLISYIDALNVRSRSSLFKTKCNQII